MNRQPMIVVAIPAMNLTPMGTATQSAVLTDQQIAETLAKEWEQQPAQAPENDLHPDPARLAFDLRVLNARFEQLIEWAQRQGYRER